MAHGVARLHLSPVIALIIPALLAGCGSNMGQVHGKITFEGQPVTSGSVTFAPKVPADQFEAGRPASGAPNAAGEFQLSTFRKNDGALVGPHIVTYLAPQAPESVDPVWYAERLKLFQKYGKCRLPKGYVVEVKPGRNDITLELSQ